MADVLTREQRRHNMQRVRGRNTKPEMLLRRGLHARGFRYRLHRRGLPGRPDLVFPKHHAVIFVHGCFWHGHDCPLFKWPATRQEFWSEKIERNRARDRRVIEALKESGWRVLVVWECALRGPKRSPFDEILEDVATFLTGRQESFQELFCASEPIRAAFRGGAAIRRG